MLRSVLQFATVGICALLVCGCRTASSKNGANLLTMETSEALEEACRREFATADSSELAAAESDLAVCAGSSELVRAWTAKTYNRFRENWPKDYLAEGPAARECLERLTNGSVARYLESMTQSCGAGSKGLDEIRTFLSAARDEGACFEFVRMTSDGCFVVEGCQGQKLDPKAFGISNVLPANSLVLCNENIQAIHKIKDPGQQNLLYNYAYVSELTGKQSYNRVTYGAPNCHGTAQAAAGGLLDDFQMSGVFYSRESLKTKCEPAASNFFTTHKSTPIGKIPMTPGGVLINMKYEGCSASDCGDVNLWVEQCESDQLTLAVFIQDMCVSCWEKKLAAGGLFPKKTNYTGQQLAPRCIATTNDHSVIILGQSQGMCFYYEATSPYGPPQVRATPCAVVNHMFSRQYCPQSPKIDWKVRALDSR